MDSLAAMPRNPHHGPPVQEWFDEEEKRTPGFIADIDADNLRAAIVADLKKMRAAEELTQAQLGERMKVKQPVIARIESGTDLPDLTTLHRYAQALGYMLKVSFVRQPQFRKKRSARGQKTHGK